MVDTDSSVLPDAVRYRDAAREAPHGSDTGLIYVYSSNDYSLYDFAYTPFNDDVTFVRVGSTPVFTATMQGELVGYRVLANDRPAEESVTELRLDDATLKVTVAGAENMLTQMTDANGLQAFEVSVPVGAS